MTWTCTAVRKPSVSVNSSAFVSHFFDAAMSTCCWLRSCGCRPCKAFWDHCLLTLLLYSSSVAKSFSFACSKSSGVCLSFAFTTAAWTGDEVCLIKKYFEGVSLVYHAAELYRSSLSHPSAMVQLIFPLLHGGGEICTLWVTFLFWFGGSLGL